MLGIVCGGGVEEPWIRGASWMRVLGQNIIDSKVLISMFLRQWINCQRRDVDWREI